MATESIDSVDAAPPVSFAYGARPSGYGLAVDDAMSPESLAFGHRPGHDFATDPPPAPSYVEGYLMSGVRVGGARATWVSAGAPDFSGTYAPSGASLVLSSITIVKRGFNAA